MSFVADIETLLDEVVTLPSLSDSIIRVTALLDDPDSSLQDVGQAIATDPALSLKALRLVNSAYYGLRDKITAVEHCVALLGMKVIKNVVHTAAVFETLQGGEELHLQHSVACGFAMRELAKQGLPTSLPFEDPEEAFMFGLLHDVGKLIFKEHLPEQYEQVAAACADKPISWHSAEIEIIGVDHGAVGAALARKWKLSDSIVSAIDGHHDLSRVTTEEFRGVAALLAVADALCYEARMPCHADAKVLLTDDVWAAAGTSLEACAGVIEELRGGENAISELSQCALA